MPFWTSQIVVTGAGRDRVRSWQTENGLIFFEGQPDMALTYYPDSQLDRPAGTPQDLYILTPRDNPPTYNGRQGRQRWRFE